MSNQIKNETSARYPRNIYFSAEAWNVLNNLSKVKSETQVEVEGLSINLKKLSKGLTILKCLSHTDLEYRFDNYIQLVETIVSSLENKIEKT